MKEVFQANITSDGGRLNVSEAMTPSRWIVPELTNASPSPRLRGERVLFMSQDTQGESQKVGPREIAGANTRQPSEASVNPASFDKIAEAKGMRVSDRDKEWNAKLRKRGRAPIGGGAPALDEASFYNDILRDFVERWNTDTVRKIANHSLTTDYIRQRELDIQHLLDSDRTIPRDEASRILENMNDWMTETRIGEQHARIGDSPFEIERIRKLEEEYPNMQRTEIMDFLEGVSVGVQMDQDVINFVADFATTYPQALDYIINKIIAVPLEAETADYRLGFYADNNLKAIAAEVKKRADSAEYANPEKQKLEAQYSKIELLETGVLFAHQMNKEIVTGKIDKFIDAASGITPQHLQLLQDTKGVSLVMRLYEEEFQRILARDGRIDEENYTEMMGKVMDTTTQKVKHKDKVTGAEWEDDVKYIKRGQGTVETYLRALNEAKDKDKLEEWEIRWALNVGRNFYNITLRAAEQISLGDVPGYISLPQENAARLMNWIGFIGRRFKIADVRGAQELLKLAVDFYQEARGEQGYGETNLKKISNRKIEEFEYAGMFGVSGIWSSWRQNEILLNQAPMTKEQTIGEYIDGRKGDNNKDKKTGKGRIAMDPAFLKETFLEGNGDLKEEFSSGLGILLKIGEVNPTEIDSPEIVKAKAQIREAIWVRVARDNPLAIANFLNGIDFKDGRKMDVFKNITSRLNDKDENSVWNRLRSKLISAQEKRLAAAVNREDSNLDRFISNLTEDERTLLNDIRTVGNLVAKEFAGVRFPFTPFMNDVIYEKAKYSNAGSLFYTRRAGGDLPAFNNGYNEYSKVVGNPGGTSPEKVFEALYAMVEALGSPQGTDVGQDKAAPFLEAYLTAAEEGSDIESKGKMASVLKWARKQALVSATLHTFHKPTSLLQKRAGMGAPSDKEFETLGHLQTLLQMGVLRREKRDEKGNVTATDLYEKFRKKFKVKLGGLLLAILRDWLVFALIGTAFELGKNVKDAK